MGQPRQALFFRRRGGDFYLAAGRWKAQVSPGEQRLRADGLPAFLLKFLDALLHSHLFQHGGHQVFIRFKQGLFRVAHAFRQPPENFLVGQGLPQGVHGLGLRADIHVEITESQVVKLQETGGRQNDVGVIRRVRLKAVNHHREEVLTGQGLPQPSLIRRGRGRVGVPDEQGAIGVRVRQLFGKIHVAHRLRLRGGQLGSGQFVKIQSGNGRRVGDVTKSGAGFAYVSRPGGQQADGAHGVAAAQLALKALPHP